MKLVQTSKYTILVEVCNDFREAENSGCIAILQIEPSFAFPDDV